MPKDNLNIIEIWENYYEMAIKAQKPIDNKIDEILHLIFETFGSKLTNWYISGYEDSEKQLTPDMLKYEFIDGFNTTIKPQISRELVIIDKNGEEMELTYGSFPVRWILTDIEEVKKELEDGKIKFEQAEEQKKIKDESKRLENKNKKDELKKKAFKKLSKEERKALGVK